MAKTTKAKSTSTTKRVAKKPTTTKKRVATKKAAAAEAPFMQARVTDQTLYWLIFGAAAIIFALWLFSLDAKVRDLYDQIDANTHTAEPTLNISADSDVVEE